jgi:NAD(P)-dependent dehydrogenase (short-subunit alcohol dehydrogenase family)
VFVGVRDLTNVALDNPNLIPILLDVTDDRSIRFAFDMVKSKTDHIDYLINNAGLNKDSATNNNKDIVCKLSELDRTALIRMFDVNAIAPIMMLKVFLPLLITDPTYVINISSGRSSYQDEYENTNGNYGYRASKAALNMLTHASTWDLPVNIRTFAVHPGGVKTDMNPTGVDLPVVQAERIIDITRNWKDEFNGKFLRYNGVLYPL